MQYNPYREDLSRLTLELNQLQLETARLRTECERYDRFDVEHVLEQRRAVDAAFPIRQAKVQHLAESLNKTSYEVNDLTRRTSAGLNPFFRFSDERKALLRRLSEAKGVAASLSKQLDAATASLNKLHEKSKVIGEAQRWYTSFDRNAAAESLKAFAFRILEIEEKLPSIREKSDKLEAKLRPVLSDLNAAQRRYDEAVHALRNAENYDRALSRASSGYDKRQIHEECGRVLGCEKPGQVIARSKRTAAAAQREIEKLQHRAAQVAKRELRRIDRIIFDGNNLCYSSSKQFIGIAPLKAIARELNTDAAKIMVFDASIRRHGYNERKLAHAIGCGVTVHIVNGAADETILDLAPGDNDYVVSNDRFADFREKPAVAGRRVFRHEHVDNKVMIHDLDLSVSYV